MSSFPVSIGEQTSIEFANIVGLTEPEAACYSTKEFLRSPCYLRQGSYFSCKKLCCLPSFDLTSTMVKMGVNALKKYIDGWVSGNAYIFDINDYDVIKDIFNGVNGYPISNPRNRNYYNVYRSDYSHQNLRYCDETIGEIIAFFAA